MLTLLIGDLHIPERSIEIPPKFRKLLAPNPNQTPSNNKISQVLCLGNLTNSFDTLKFLTNLSPSFNLVKGEFDNSVILSQQLNELNLKIDPIPYHQTIQNGNLKIGFTNGYQVIPKNDPLSLLNLARELDVDILVWGGTHKVEAYTLDEKFFINPGSVTGSYSFDWPDNEDDDEEEEDEEDEPEEEEEENGEEKNADVKEEQNGETQDSKTEETESDKPVENEKDEELNNEITDLSSSIPSFCLLDTNGNKCTAYIYTYIEGEVKVDKVTYQKE